MHLFVVDRLTCPRCGPAFPLILLAERVVDRRVLAGWLGCSNCRDRFPIVDGFGDVRAPPRRELPPVTRPVRAGDSTESMRLGALLGVVEGPAQVLLLGPIVAHAGGLAAMIPELEVIALSHALRDEPESPGVSRMVAAPGLPFRSASLQGVAIAGPAGESDEPLVLTAETSRSLLEEAARVVAPSGRVVLIGASEQDRENAEAAGLHVVFAQEGVLVGTRPGPRGRSAGVRLPVVG